MGRRRTCDCGRCRKCKDRIRKAAQYRAKTPEERRAWKARKDPVKRYITDRRARRRHVERNPEKVEARKTVARALKAGTLVRMPCYVCGIEHGQRRSDGSRVRVEGHHADYGRPLEVRWLCGDHHRPPWVPDRG